MILVVDYTDGTKARMNVQKAFQSQRYDKLMYLKFGAKKWNAIDIKTVSHWR